MAVMMTNIEKEKVQLKKWTLELIQIQKGSSWKEKHAKISIKE